MKALAYSQLPGVLSLSQAEIALVLQVCHHTVTDPSADVPGSMRRTLAGLELLAKLEVLDTAARLLAAPHIIQIADLPQAVVRLADRRWLAVRAEPGFIDLSNGEPAKPPDEIVEKLQYDLDIIVRRRGLL